MNQNHRIWSFIKAKGFYIALALCITGAGTAAWLTAQNTISGIREQQQRPPAVTEQGEGNQWDYEDILQQQTGGEANTPKPSLPTSPSPTPENPAPTQPVEQFAVRQNGNASVQCYQILFYLEVLLQSFPFS